MMLLGDCEAEERKGVPEVSHVPSSCVDLTPQATLRQSTKFILNKAMRRLLRQATTWSNDLGLTANTR